jgi:hypothetical protein
VSGLLKVTVNVSPTWMIPSLVDSIELAALFAICETTLPLVLLPFSVPRYLGWVETSSRGQSQIEFAGQQIDDGL